MKTILLTGAAGMLGRQLRTLLLGKYKFRLSDIRPIEDLAPGETFIHADVSDLSQVEAAAEGVDAIVHFGGLPVEHSWAEILHSNIVGNYNVFEAARTQSVPRVVFASSNQALGFYPRTRRLGTAITLRPSSRYGLSKMFGEGVGALYADKHGLRVFCIRIGRCPDLPDDLRRLSVWLHPADLAQLVRIGLEHPDVHYEIVYGISDNQRAWYDNERATQLGYRPTGHAEDHYAHAAAAQVAVVGNPVADMFMGGRLCGLEYTGDISRSGK